MKENLSNSSNTDFFKSETFKEMANDIQRSYQDIADKESTLTSVDILTFASKALDNELSMIEDPTDSNMSSALKHFVITKICNYFKIKSIYTTNKLFDNTLLLPMEQFVGFGKPFTDAMDFVSWFIPFEMNHQKLILTNVLGQGESSLSFETLDEAKVRYGNSAWSQIKIYYPIEDIFN